MCSMVADVVLFNSYFNMHSFLDNISGFFRTMPDYRPKGLAEKIKPKCEVLYFPIEFPDISAYEADYKEGQTDSAYRMVDAHLPGGHDCQQHYYRTEMSGADNETSCKSQHITSIYNVESESEQNVTLNNDGTKTVDSTNEGETTPSVSADLINLPSSDTIESVDDQTTRTACGIHSTSRLNMCSEELLHDNSAALHIIWPHRW
jgi:Domain of unknown function (DUF3524)